MKYQKEILEKDEREIDKKLNCDLFSNNTKQIKIFIGSLDNSEQKWSLFEYWQNSKELSDYRGQKFLDDLIENKFNYM